MFIVSRSVFICFLLIVLPLALYWVGIDGPFILDDLPNLSAMMSFGGVVDWPSALYFIGSNESGPLGRPLSMASFLINDHAWPSDASSFKYTNLMIHIINGFLVFWFLLLLFSHKRLGVHEKLVYLMATAGALYWLLHPIQVSTVLYVVQRMTLLSSTMMLAGLVVYLKWRPVAFTSMRQCALLFLLGLLGVIGVLFKETAVLLVVYVVVLELALFSSVANRLTFANDESLSEQNYPQSHFFRFAIALSFALLLFIVLYKAVGLTTWDERDFTLWERFNTQLVILWEYLGQIYFPRSSLSSLFYDDHVVYQSAWVAFISISLGLSLFCLACRYVGGCWAVLIFGWYLGGHVLESSILPLELYFEHRNYLPLLVGVFTFSALFVKYQHQKMRFYTVFSVYSVALLFVSWGNVTVWADEPLMRKVWAEQSPDSVRAQQNNLGKMINEGGIERADRLFQEILNANPDDHLLAMQGVNLDCLMGREVNKDKFLSVLSTGKNSHGVHDGVLVLREILLKDGCGGFGLNDLDNVLLTLIGHEGYQYNKLQSFFYRELGVNQVLRRDLNSAMNYVDKAVSLNESDISLILMQVNWLVSAGLKVDALRYIDMACSRVSNNPFKSPMQLKLINREAKDHGFWSQNEDFCRNSGKK